MHLCQLTTWITWVLCLLNCKRSISLFLFLNHSCSNDGQVAQESELFSTCTTEQQREEGGKGKTWWRRGGIAQSMCSPPALHFLMFVDVVALITCTAVIPISKWLIGFTGSAHLIFTHSSEAASRCLSSGNSRVQSASTMQKRVLLARTWETHGWHWNFSWAGTHDKCLHS